MPGSEIAELVTTATPFVTAAAGAYGTAVLSKVRDDAADATVGAGRRSCNGYSAAGGTGTRCRSRSRCWPPTRATRTRSARSGWPSGRPSWPTPRCWMR
jgi:hypothetical protein